MKKYISILLAFAFATISLLPSEQVAAASNSLGVNPRRDYDVQPGEKIQDVLNVTNLHKSETLYISIRPIDFKAGNQTGDPDLLLKQTEPTRWSLKPFLTIPSGYTIAPGSSVDVPFTVAIPKNQGAGSYYSAIHYAITGENNANNSTGVSLSGSGVSLIFVRVGGQAKSLLQLKDFGAFTPTEDLVGGAFSNFYGASRPKYISYTLENKGNIAEQPSGSLQLKNIFGKQVKLYEKVNPHENLVLIEQTRRIDLCLNEATVTQKNNQTGQDEEVRQCNDMNLLPGRYTASMSLLYGSNGNSSSEIRATTSFWYLPVWFIVLVVIGLLAVAFLVWKAVNQIKNFRKPTYGTRRR